MSLNVTKSSFILYSLRENLKLNITLNDECIAQKDHIKYLGIILDRRLSWKNHIEMISKKMSQGLGILARLKHFASKSILKSVYHSFIISHAKYGLENWSSASKCSKKRIEIIIKKAVRIISDKPYNFPSLPCFCDMKLLSFPLMEQECKFIFFFKLMNNYFPKHFSEKYFILPKLTYNLRSKDKKFFLHSFTSKVGKESIFFKGITEWNKTQHLLDLNVSIFTFKKYVKNYLLSFLHVDKD